MTIAFNLSQLANYVNSSGKLDAANGLVNATPVANGGTGSATLTANNVLLGNGTSAVQVVAPSTSGNVLTSNGTTWQSSTPVVSGFTHLQVFTSSATWTVPAGVTKCKVTVIGGGGGGGNGGGDDVAFFGGGGGGGGTAIKILSSLTSTVSVTIGSSGGTSSFGSYCSASGGGGGSNASGSGPGPAGSGGNGSSGDLNITGVSGFGGQGGASALGGGSYGMGGGGGYSDGSYGAAGTSGVIIVEY